MIDNRSSRTERSRPFRADRAWRRKLMTETPAISSGYWKARKMPALPRTSGDQSVISSPRNRTDPEVTSYSGLPSSTEARVDLPEPLGPMRAWISPGWTTRSTPRRISTPSVVEAWRSVTSNIGSEPRVSDTLQVYGPGGITTMAIGEIRARFTSLGSPTRPSRVARCRSWCPDRGQVGRWCPAGARRKDGGRWTR